MSKGFSRSAQEARPARPLSREQQELVRQHIGLVGMHLRKRVPTRWQPTRDREYDDLFQEGCLALLRAAARYCPENDGPFAAFALPRIRGAVHIALFEYFQTIRVPLASQRAPSAGGDANRFETVSLPPPALIAEDRTLAATRWQGRVPDQAARRERLARTSESESAAPADAGSESVRHHLRRCFEHALRGAIQDLAHGRLRVEGRLGALRRIADERILISEESARTPLRQLADLCGISSGRACEYERQLLDLAGELLTDDVRVPLLLDFAWSDPLGFDAPVDAATARELEQAGLQQFEARFASASRQVRAEQLLRLIEASNAVVEEVVRNLYRLTAG